MLNQIDIPEAELSRLCRSYHVTELSIFGSALRDDFRPDSDIDLLVLFQPDARIGLLEFVGLQEELAALLGRKVDLVPKRGMKPVIRDEVIGAARLLYAA